MVAQGINDTYKNTLIKIQVNGLNSPDKREKNQTRFLKNPLICCLPIHIRQKNIEQLKATI